jgi:hypothetical protein
MRYVIVGLAVIAVVSFTIVYAGVNALCDDSWPDWT